jgi:hypothetical protein
LALLALPALWWLLRAVPPTPLRLRFPPFPLLARLASHEQSVQRTPPWLLVLRIALAAMIVVGLAHPLLDAAKPLAGNGPVILIVDDGWTAAQDWQVRQDALASVVERADREARSVVLVATAPEPASAKPPSPRLMNPAEARERIRALEPRPWHTRRADALDQLLASPALKGKPPGAVIWLSDGIEEGEPAPTIAEMARSLLPFGSVTLSVPAEPDRAIVLRPPLIEGNALVVEASRPAAGEALKWVRALTEDGAVLAREPLHFEPGATRSAITAALPLEMINRITRLELESETTAGSVVLLDERWRRRPVGIVSDQGPATDLPLLGDTYYLERALEPSAEVRRGSVAGLLGRELAVLFLADSVKPDENAAQAIHTWVRQGGVLVRFAGPLLAARAERDEPLLPTPLRVGDRVLGGSMAWREPARLAPFDAESPFTDLVVPPDVSVRRQVLVEPASGRDYSTWARLDDGTPLVTAARRGDGWIVLFHITANAEWSSLPLSGLFVQMLERMTDMSRIAGVKAGGPPLEPAEILDGFGRLGPPPAAARSIESLDFAETVPGPVHPPGFYGLESRRQALNLSSALPDPVASGPMPADIAVTGYDRQQETDLRPWLLGLGLGLAVLDLAISIAMRGLFRWPSLPRWGRIARRLGGVVALTLMSSAAAGHACAQTIVADGSAVAEALSTSLAYVRTSDPQVDEVSRAGLAGLSVIVNRRTAAELADPVGIDVASDELSFYPLIYWPIVGAAAAPSAKAADNLRTYMAHGGTLLFDIRSRSGDGTVSQLSLLRSIAAALDIPPLAPVPAEHVLGRAYYLLPDFPGRRKGPVWIERVRAQNNDGVASVIAGGNDWAGAWAMDEYHRPIFPVVPGGERQREQAFRFGINLVMYTLTGNYKADQVHLPAIMERLGH